MKNDGEHAWFDTRPFKRKRCRHHLRVRPEKSTACQAIVPNQFQGEGEISHLAPRPLRAPNFDEGKPTKPIRRRYYPFSIQKMVRLVGAQTKFLCQFLHLRDVQSRHATRYKALSHHIGVCRAEPTSSKLAFFYVANTTIRGTCVAKQKHRRCVVLGMEYRQEAPSFRLYLAYFSPTRFYHICRMRFLINEIMYKNHIGNCVTNLVLDFCFYGLVKKGFEIVGAHYMDPRKIKGKPDVCVSQSKRPRNFTNMWNGEMGDHTKKGLDFLIQHARRDVQVFDLRVESKVYTTLMCGAR